MITKVTLNLWMMAIPILWKSVNICGYRYCVGLTISGGGHQLLSHTLSLPPPPTTYFHVSISPRGTVIGWRFQWDFDSWSLLQRLSLTVSCEGPVDRWERQIIARNNNWARGLITEGVWEIYWDQQPAVLEYICIGERMQWSCFCQSMAVKKILSTSLDAGRRAATINQCNTKRSGYTSLHIQLCSY